MCCKEKAIVYPYDSQFTPVLRYGNLIEQLDIVGLSSPRGWALGGKDASWADNGCFIDLIVDNRFEELLDQCDTVIFTKSDYEVNFKSMIYPKIIIAIKAKKNIICLFDLENERASVEEYCNENNVYFKNYIANNIPDDDFHGDSNNNTKDLQDINVPVISVMGTTEETNKFSIQLDLRTRIMDLGYKVSQIGTRSYCELLGFHSFPNFMLGHSMPEYEKILLFNRYIKSIEIQEKPDIIIIGIPGGIMPVNNQIHNYFGITAYEVYQAVLPDASILSMLYEEYNKAYIENICNLIKYRYGFEITCFNITNKTIDWLELVNAKPKEIQCCSIRSEIVENIITELNKYSIPPVFNLVNNNDSMQMTKLLIDKLADNANVELV